MASDELQPERCPLCGSRNAFAMLRHPTSTDYLSGVCVDCKRGWFASRGYADQWERMGESFPAIGLTVFDYAR